MRGDPPEETLLWAEESVGPGSRIVSVSEAGGRWHVNHFVDVADRRGHVHRLVLRRWARPGWEHDDPDFTVEREVGVLSLLEETRVPAPRVVAADATSMVCDAPALLVTRLEGKPPSESVRPPELLRGLAAALTVVHSIDDEAASHVPPYRRFVDPAQAAVPAWLPDRRLWEEVFEVVRSPPPLGPSGFIHRDYHPGNTLWSGDRLTGVVDWTQASMGPHGVDVGHLRSNLAIDVDPAAADAFLDRYRAITGPDAGDQRYWDLVTSVDLAAAAGSRLAPSAAARLERFVREIVRRL